MSRPPQARGLLATRLGLANLLIVDKATFEKITLALNRWGTLYNQGIYALNKIKSMDVLDSDYRNRQLTEIYEKLGRWKDIEISVRKALEEIRAEIKAKLEVR